MASNSKWTLASIIIFSSILGGLVLGIVYIGIIIYYNPKLLDEQLIPLAGTLANLILTTISIITMILNRKYTLESIRQTDEAIQKNNSYNVQTLEQTNTMIKDNRKYNEQTLEQTKKLLKQNSDHLFVQLRFKDAKEGINDLMLFLQITLNISYNYKSYTITINQKKRITYPIEHF